MREQSNLKARTGQPLTNDEIELEFLDIPVAGEELQQPQKPQACEPPSKLELAAPSNSSNISISHENHDLTTEIEGRVGPPFIDTKGGCTINQSFFAESFRVTHEIIYDHGSGGYYQYNTKNGCYDRQRADTVRVIITDDIFKRAKERNIHGIGAKITRNLQISIEGMAKELVSHNDFFGRDPLEPPIIHVANAMLVFEVDGTMSQRPFGSHHRSRNQIPMLYDPGANCPRLLNDLFSPVLNPEDIDLIQRYMGLILIGGNRAQKLLMLTGLGGTGKGTLVNLITTLLGSQNVEQLRVAQLNGRFETSRFIGKMLLTIIEAPADIFNQDGAEVVKALVGHDEMKAEKKNISESLRIRGCYPIILTSNEQLRIRLAGDDLPWGRRLLNVDYRKPRPIGAKIIDNFHEVLLNEAGPGILNWMITGAKAHWRELTAETGFAVTQEQKERVENILLRSRSIEIFLKTKVSRKENFNLSVAELYHAYCQFCNLRQWHPLPQRKFEQSTHELILEIHGAAKSNDIMRDGKSAKGYRHLTLN